MVVKKSVNLQQPINSKYNPRANFAPIGNDLAAPFNELTGIVHDGGISPLYKLTNSSSESIKTMTDDDRIVELKAENVSYPQIVKSLVHFEKGTDLTPANVYGLGAFYLNSTWIILQRATNTAYTSTDFINWTTRTLGSINNFYTDVCFDGTRFCFVYAVINGGNYDHYISTTTDFVSYTDNLAGSTVGGALQLSIAYGGGYYNILAYDGTNTEVYSSTDRVTWGETVTATGVFYEVRYLNGEFWCYDYNTNVLRHSADGVLAYTTETCGLTAVEAFTFANGKYIAIGQNAGNVEFSYSATGLTGSWSAATTITSAQNMYGNIVWTGTYYFAFGSDRTNGSTLAFYSADGISWTSYVLVYEYPYMSAVYGSNRILVSAVTPHHMNIVVNAGGLRTESIYRAYIAGNKTGEEMIKYGIYTNAATSVYQDVKFGTTKAYGAKIVGDTVEIDTINPLTFARIANSSTVTANQVRNTFFLKDISASDNKHIAFNVGGNTYIYTARLSAAVAVTFGNGYYLSGGAGTSYVLLMNEIISGIDGKDAKIVRTYSMNETTGAMTQIATHTGWFYSAVYGGELYVIGVEDLATDAFKVYSISTVGVWTEVFTEDATYAINGLLSEYDVYQTFSLLAAYNATSYAGTGVDTKNILGYMSVIDSFTDGTNDFYLRAVYNRATAIQDCDSLSFTINDRYIARSISVSDVDFTYRPQFFKYAVNSRYYIIYRDTSGKVNLVCIDDLANCATQFTKLKNNVYLINTLDVYNVLDCDAEVVVPTGMDYNGASLRDDTANYDERSKIVNDLYETEYNPSETGRPPQAEEMMSGYKDQQLIYTTLTKRIYAATGDLLELTKYNSETYMDDHSYINIDATAKIQNGFIFVTNNIYPSAYTTNNIVGRIMNYDLTAQIGQTFPQADFFFLFGNYYMYDGEKVYLLNVLDGSTSEVCMAVGLSFICFSQEAAFFWSYTTNDLYTFNGGRSVDQLLEMHEFFTVDTTTPITGDYLASDNVLVLSKNTKVALMYDGKLSKYDATTGTAFARANGIYYKTATGIDAIAKHKLTVSYSSVSYTWKTAYFKNPGIVSNISEVQLLFYSATKAAGTLTAYFYAVDETQVFTTQTVTRVIASGDYDTDGYWLGKFTPDPDQAYGFAVGVLVPIDVQLMSCDIAVDDLRPCTVSAGNTMQ